MDLGPVRTHARGRSAPTLLLVLLAMTGCGDRTAPDPADAGESTGTSESTEPTVRPPKTTTPPSEAKQKIRVVGEIISVGDCVVVRDDNDITWTLTGDAVEGLAVGDRVQVTGAPDLLATGCGGPLVTATTITVTN